MTYQTLVIILWVILGLFICALLFALGLLIYQLGKKSTIENPDNAVVFNVNGQHLEKPIRATVHIRTAKTIVYKYGKRFIAVPRIFKTIYYQGKRLIFANNYKLISINLDNDKSLEDSEKETLLQEMLKADIGGGAIRAIQSTKFALNIITIIVAFIVGIVVTFGFIKIQEQIKVQQQQQQLQQQPNQQDIPAR